MEALTRAVPFSAACWAPVDPASRLITGGMKSDGIGDDHDEDWIFHEYEGPDRFNFQTLADRPGGVSTALTETGGDLARSERFTDLYQRHWGDISDEVRIELRAGGTTWGYLALFRDGRCSAFTPAEQEYLSGVRATLAVGLRAGMLVSSAVELLPARDGPVVLVVDAAGEIVQASIGAVEGMAELGGAPIGRGRLPFGLRTLVAAARQFTLGRYPVPPRMRMRDRSGRWMVAHASPLLSCAGIGTDVVITLEEARPPEIVPLVVAAFGLTSREQAVLALVLRGVDTAEMTHTLHLSGYTVQDHLKSIFTKSGVRSRRELIAKVFYDQYAPRLAAGAALAPSGWFAE
ncbi:helix-turn-helix transcriptional regulator [Pseudonocardia sp. EC080619-01]|uniref:helix-turn-helix transcriptional regulator n=2 Tax=unclassified Pseudonocardia TaxID=2619320 RepID=UPI0009E9EEA7|nr:helix-turn-helix transcriptional regulator [Pseudonocardia sp. EC080619-01]